jgi:hypothetical protein
VKRYVWGVLIALDQLINALLGGDPDETVSSRCAKNQHKAHWRVLGRVLEWIDPGHLSASIERDEGGDAAFPNL